jgi:hypothetical protein
MPTAAAAGGSEQVGLASSSECADIDRRGSDSGRGGGGGGNNMLRPSELLSRVSAEAEAARALTTTSDFLKGHGWSSPLGGPAPLVVSLSGEMGRAAAVAR